MSTATAAIDTTEGAPPVRKSGKKKLLLLTIPVALVIAGVGAWFAGLIPDVFGAKKAPPVASSAPAVVMPTYIELPEIIANLNAGARRTSFVKMQARLELSKPEDLPIVTAAQPRIMDLFQTYLREMRPDELRGSLGTYRLREQLIARASLAVAPARVVDVLFTELLVQ
jgi:flagellar FliL protein